MQNTVYSIIKDAFNTLVGTLANPLRTDPTGTTVQPVSIAGDINATINNLDVSDRVGRLVGHVAVDNIPHVIVDTAPSTAVTGTFWQGTQPITGNLTHNNAVPGTAHIGALTALANAATPTFTEGDEVLLSANLTGQVRATANIGSFGSNAVVTGTGVSGVGIPRVTIANDSNILATQSGTWNVGTVTTLTGITNALPSGANVIGHVIVDTAPSTAVTNAGLTNIDVALSTRLKPADTLTGITTVGSVTAITNSLPAGTNVLGHVIVDTATLTSTNDGSVQIGGIVDDTAGNYIVGQVKALALTTEGRLRVSTVPSDINQVWQYTLSNPWDSSSVYFGNDPWEMENVYV